MSHGIGPKTGKISALVFFYMHHFFSFALMYLLPEGEGGASDL